MPFTNNPDKFFIADGNINVLLELIRQQRQALLSLNRYTPENNSLQLLKDDIIRISKISLINKGYNSLSKSLKKGLDKNLEKFMANTNAISEAYILTNKDSKKFIDDFLAEKLKNQDSIPDIFGKTTNLVDTYVKNVTIGDSEYDIPKIPQNTVEYGYSNSYAVGTGDKISVSTPTFPEFGNPYNNHMDDISDRMSSKEDFASSNGEKIYKGWIAQTKDGNIISDPIKTFTKKTPFSSQISQILKAEFGNSKKMQPPGTVKFFIEKLHGRYSNGMGHKKGELISQSEVIADGNDFSNRMVFSAYIDDFSESFSSDWGSYNFIGRGENVPIFKSTTRTLTLNFNIVADYSLDLMMAMEKVYEKLGFKEINEGKIEEIIKDRANWGMGYVGLPTVSGDNKLSGGHIPGMYSDTTESLWHKLTFLAQCVYPYYRQDGKMKEQPIVRLRLADFYDVTGYISSYSVNTNDMDNIIDLNPSAIGNIPMGAKITMSFTIIHDHEPSENSLNFYHRKEYDMGTADADTGKGLAKNNQSIISETYNSKSDLQEKLADKVNVSALTDDKQAFYKNLVGFSSALNDVKKIGINAPAEIIKKKNEKAMRSFVRISEIADELGIRYGLSAQSEKPSTGNKIKNTFSSIFNRDKLLGIKASVENFAIDEGLDILSGQQTFDGAFSNAKIKGKENIRKTGDKVFSGVLGDILGTSELNRLGLNNLNRDSISLAVSEATSNINKIKMEPKTIGDIINNNKNLIINKTK